MFAGLTPESEPEKAYGGEFLQELGRRRPMKGSFCRKPGLGGHRRWLPQETLLLGTSLLSCSRTAFPGEPCFPESPIYLPILSLPAAGRVSEILPTKLRCALQPAGLDTVTVLRWPVLAGRMTTHVQALDRDRPGGPGSLRLPPRGPLRLSGERFGSLAALA